MRNDRCSSQATEYPVWNWRWHYETCHNTSMGFIRCLRSKVWQTSVVRHWGKRWESHPWTGSEQFFWSRLKKALVLVLLEYVLILKCLNGVNASRLFWLGNVSTDGNRMEWCYLALTNPRFAMIW